MNLKQLKQLADPDSVKATLNEDNGIVSVVFVVRGLYFTAQYSTNIKGIYAFALSAASQADELFEMIKATGESNDEENS